MSSTSRGTEDFEKHAMTPEKIGYELIAQVAGLEIEVLATKTTPTTDDDFLIEMECRVEKEDVEVSAFGILFTLAALSFSEAKPAGSSVIDFEEEDAFQVADLVEHMHFSRAGLELDLDYLRGRRMKTRITLDAKGRLFIRTMGRDLAPERWVMTLQGKKRLRLVSPIPESS